MLFQIQHHILGPGSAAANGCDHAYTWELVKTDGEVVAKGPREFQSEPAARSNIASAKRSMKGAARCKVVSPE